MKEDQILSYPPRVLTQAEREHYFSQGYVAVRDRVPANLIAELLAVTHEFVDSSRRETESGDIYDIGPGHNADRPVLRRLKKPDDRHQAFWQFASGLLADIAVDLAGPDVVFHHSKLNFKWFDSSDTVKWHQDTQFFPHTNYNVFTIGCYLADTHEDNGPLAVLPGSHNGPLYDLYAPDGSWSGSLRDADAAALDTSTADYLMGAAGTLTIHNCRTVHYSPASRSPEPRPLLLNCYSSADAKAYTPHPDPSSHAYELVRGAPALWADHDPRPCLIPPDWSGGYSSIFASQAGEAAR